jgi:hypothetical protein
MTVIVLFQDYFYSMEGLKIMDFKAGTCDVAVIGAGHAGISVPLPLQNGLDNKYYFKP